MWDCITPKMLTSDPYQPPEDLEGLKSLKDWIKSDSHVWSTPEEENHGEV